MSAQQEVIKKFMASLDKTTKKGTAALDEAIKACSNFNTIQEVINKMINDCENASSADDFLKNYCGINLDSSNKDTGAITGSDAGGSKVKTAVSIVPESGSIKNFTSDSFKVNGLTLKLDTSYSNLTEDQKFIWQGLYTWWAKSALDLILESYGYSFNDNDATVKTITVKFLYEESGLRANTYGEFPNGITMNLIDFGINNYLYCNFDLSNVNGKSTNDSLYLDRTIAHELTHGIMATKINYYGALPMLIREGIAELTHGSDDDSKNDLKTLAGNSDLLRQSLVLSTKYNEVAGVGSPDYSAGYMFFRYLAKQASTNSSSNIITGTNNADNLSNSLSGATINALSGNDEVYNYGSKSVVNLGAGNDTIGNYGNNTTINADAGKDYIGNAAAYSSINGGADNDTIFSSAS
ncbi:MAG: hypothetical protein IJ728_10975, partial [Selenomonadaceae bacterium]|nr:hypothetical protein [Selenomonadaceae bacterium]